jgi:hypothetical protein
MQGNRFALAALLLIPLLAACGPGEEEAAIVVDSRPDETRPTPGPQTPELTQPEVSQRAIDGFVAGEITLVDEVGGSFVLNDAAGMEWAFLFDTDTEVTGSSGAQGLTGQTGSLVVVHYQGGDPASRRAVRVEIGSNN